MLLPCCCQPVSAYNIMQSIAELMVHPDILPLRNLVALEFEAHIGTDERCFSRLSDSYWWENTEARIRRNHGGDSYLLPIILHLDSTTLDATSKNAITPVSITLGNFGLEIQVCVILLPY